MLQGLSAWASPAATDGPRPSMSAPSTEKLLSEEHLAALSLPLRPCSEVERQTTNTAGAFFFFCFISTDLKQQLRGAIPSVKKHPLFLLLFDISMDKPNVLTSNLIKHHGFCSQAGHSSLQQHMQDLSSEIEHWCYTQH